MNTFKLRSEAIVDCMRAIELLLCGAAFKMESVSLGEVYMTFGANLNLYEVRELLKEIVDGHVMVQTVNYKDQFTGERYFEGYNVYIDFLNSQKGFKEDRIEFASYEEAVEWGRKTFDRFDCDLINYN